jgi:hypothetical protein
VNEPRSNPSISVIIFCFAALGFVWSVEAFVKVALQVLGL